MQAVQIRFSTADSVVQLSLESDVVVQIVAGPERGPVAQAYVVVNGVVRAGVYILITKKRTDGTELPRNLRIERWSVVNGIREVQGRVANQETSLRNSTPPAT